MNDQPQRDYGSMATAAAFAVVGGFAIWHAREFSALGSVFPRTVASAMILFALVYIAVAWLRPKGMPVAEPASTPRRVALMIVFLAWSFLLEPLGFLATSVAAYCAILVIANYDRWTPRVALGHALVGTLVLGSLYAIFRLVLQVPFPEGLLL